MDIFISIDGVLRNTIQKLDYHYKDTYLGSEIIGDDEFEYGVSEEIKNNDLFSAYKFHSKEEFDYFMYIEFPIEIFGHAGLSYATTFTDLHEMIYENQQHKFTLIGLDEIGKAKPATLFFLSKNGFLGNNIKFIKSEQIADEWEKCDIWITDSKLIIDNCPDGKDAVLFKTDYNKHFTHTKEINRLTETKELWLKYLENTTT